MKLKKILATVLCLAMVLSTMGTVAFATDNEKLASSVVANEVTENNLTFAVEFDGQNQVTDYNLWKMDIEFTVNKDILLENNNEENAVGYLSVYLPLMAQMGMGWRDLPSGNFVGGKDIKANEPVKLLEYFWADLGNNFTQSYEDIFNTQKGLKCGVFFNEEFLDNNPDLYGEFNLNIYKSENNEVIKTITLATYSFGKKAVAKVGNAEYTTIDEAIANWTNGTTLTLLDDVQLNSTIELSSTEMHTLDLGTYTMTAAKGKNAISIIPNGRSKASYALDITADANNPGGISAPGASCIYSKGKSNFQDRPIIRIYGGNFSGSYAINHSGSNGTNCPQFWIYGGTFAQISTNRALLQISGGTFNSKNYISPDSSAYTLISGGKFKDVNNNMNSALNTSKWTYGTSKGTLDVYVYVDEDGYYVVEKDYADIPAVSAIGSVTRAKQMGQDKSTLLCSKAATDGIGYVSADMAVANTQEGTLTLYTETSADVKTTNNLVIDATNANAFYNGNVKLGGSNHTFTIKLPEDATFEGSITQYNSSYYLVKNEIVENGVKTITYTQAKDPLAAGYEAILTRGASQSAYMFEDALKDAVAEDTILLLKDVKINVVPSSVALFAAREEIIIDLNGKTISPADPQIPTFETNKHYVLINGKIEGDVVSAASSLEVENVEVTGNIVNNGGNIQLTDVVLEGNLVNENGTLTVEDTAINGNVEVNSGEADLSGVVVSGKVTADETTDVAITSGTFTEDPAAFVAEGYDVIRYADKYIVTNLSEEAKAISVEFAKTDVENNEDNLEGADTYNIVLKANAGDIINELASVDLTFDFNGTPVHNGAIDYSIAPATGIALTQEADRFMFNYDGVTKVEESGAAIVIGTVTIEGYGAYTLGVKDVTTNIVNGTTVNDNLVDYYVKDGDIDASAATGALIINTDTNTADEYEGIIDTEIKVPVRTLKVTVDFPNEVKENEALYQDMKVEITGVFDGVNKTVEYNLGDDMVGGSYVIENKELVLNNAYTVTVSGAGYRTARYTVTMTDHKALRFWNNVMDEKQVVEIGKDSSKVNVTYLAGDIVKDNKINIYDLSAVVSYFGSESTVANGYAKYDLNRDGIIDSKDVAYVLVSWGN